MFRASRVVSSTLEGGGKPRALNTSFGVIHNLNSLVKQLFWSGWNGLIRPKSKPRRWVFFHAKQTDSTTTSTATEGCYKHWYNLLLHTLRWRVNLLLMDIDYCLTIRNRHIFQREFACFHHSQATIVNNGNNTISFRLARCWRQAMAPNFLHKRDHWTNNLNISVHFLL